MTFHITKISSDGHSETDVSTTLVCGLDEISQFGHDISRISRIGRFLVASELNGHIRHRTALTRSFLGGAKSSKDLNEAIGIANWVRI